MLTNQGCMDHFCQITVKAQQWTNRLIEGKIIQNLLKASLCLVCWVNLIVSNKPINFFTDKVCNIIVTAKLITLSYSISMHTSGQSLSTLTAVTVGNYFLTQLRLQVSYTVEELQVRRRMFISSDLYLSLAGITIARFTCNS